jgi:hypothetical protein
MEPGAPILDDNLNKGGLVRIGKSINTAYEKSRGVLVGQIAQNSTSLLLATGEIARWRAKTLGFSGGEVSAETCEVWLLVTLTELFAGSATITITQGSNTSTYSWSTNKSVEWVQATDLTIDDNAESLSITAEFTTSLGMFTTVLHGVCIYYKSARTTLVLDAYSQNGFHPINDEQIADDRPLAAHLMHHMHRDIEGLFEYRQGGNMVSSAFGPNNQVTSGHRYFLIYVPPGVSQFKVWYYELGSSGGGGAGGGPSDEWVRVTLLTLDFGTQIHTKLNSYTSFSIAAWDSATLNSHNPAAPTSVFPDRTGEWLVIDVETNNMEYESVCIYSVNASR